MSGLTVAQKLLSGNQLAMSTKKLRIMKKKDKEDKQLTAFWHQQFFEN